MKRALQTVLVLASLCLIAAAPELGSIDVVPAPFAGGDFTEDLDGGNASFNDLWVRGDLDVSHGWHRCFPQAGGPAVLGRTSNSPARAPVKSYTSLLHRPGRTDTLCQTSARSLGKTSVSPSARHGRSSLESVNFDARERGSAKQPARR